MRFPSLAFLAERGAAVLRRFPWPLAAGAAAAAFAIVASNSSGTPGDVWVRAAFVAALALPATIAVTLLAETRRWSLGLRTVALVICVLALIGFFLAWPGIDATPHAIRYFQLSAVLHLAVAFLPFLGAPEGAAGSLAFWQYNRRLFTGFLRALVFSGVLFVGIAIALGALDHLFGVDIRSRVYFHIWIVIALVVNTWIFLAAVPDDLPALAHDSEYPRALQVFAQYILTPLAFSYLLILLAYLIKIVVGGQWPSGWIGWLVASVSVTGLLGFLLVHPLRADAAQGWVRSYARWLFIGLAPAALMLLVAFAKRIGPYGLTEPRVLGVLLGVWLLGIALLFGLRAGASIRVIPVSLALLLFVTLYGPVSPTRLAVSSQGRRLAAALASHDTSAANAREASGALLFLIDRRAAGEIAASIGKPLPPINWTTARYAERDSVASRILATAGARFVPRYAPGYPGPARPGAGRQQWFNLIGNGPMDVAGFGWAVPVAMGDTAARLAGTDSVSVLAPGASGIARVRAGADTVLFDVAPLARVEADSSVNQRRIPAERLRLEGTAGGRRVVLAITQLNGWRNGGAISVAGWSGWLLVAKR